MFESEHYTFFLSFGTVTLVYAEVRNNRGRKGEKTLKYEGEFLLFLDVEFPISFQSFENGLSF
jgi:hypothetical protein